MPTTYTHDLFGKKVYKRLPEEMKKAVKSWGDLYRIGLHGPDIFFYFLVCKNPVTQYGVQMHNRPARSFFENAMKRVRETKDSALLAYLLGFGCHYLLDSACHPFVEELDREEIISHALLELEFDRELMLQEGKDPLHFYPSDAIVPKRSYAEVIHRAVPEIPARFTEVSLHMMKWCTNGLVCDDQEKRRRFFGKTSRLFGEKHQKFVLDHFMRETPAREAQEPIKKLKELFDDTVEKAPGTWRSCLPFPGSRRFFPTVGTLPITVKHIFRTCRHKMIRGPKSWAGRSRRFRTWKPAIMQNGMGDGI